MPNYPRAPWAAPAPMTRQRMSAQQKQMSLMQGEQAYNDRARRAQEEERALLEETKSARMRAIAMGLPRGTAESSSLGELKGWTEAQTLQEAQQIQQRQVAAQEQQARAQRQKMELDAAEERRRHREWTAMQYVGRDWENLPANAREFVARRIGADPEAGGQVREAYKNMPIHVQYGLFGGADPRTAQALMQEHQGQRERQAMSAAAQAPVEEMARAYGRAGGVDPQQMQNVRMLQEQMTPFTPKKVDVDGTPMIINTPHSAIPVPAAQAAQASPAQAPDTQQRAWDQYERLAKVTFGKDDFGKPLTVGEYIKQTYGADGNLKPRAAQRPEIEIVIDRMNELSLAASGRPVFLRAADRQAAQPGGVSLPPVPASGSARVNDTFFAGW
jgi:hypothetical protein